MNHSVHFEMFPVDQIAVDPRVQRKEGIHHGRAAAMAAAWNPNAAGTITLSRRADGTSVCLDGRHRGKAAQLAGQHLIPAMVHEGLTLAQEAALFNLLNTFKQPSYISRTLASVVAGDPTATAVVGAIEAHGWTIGADNTDGTFAAVQAAERVYRTAAGALPAGAHPEVLDRTLATITDAWRRDRESAHQMIVLGIGQVFGRFGQAVDPAALAAKLSQERPNIIIGKARAIQSGQGGTTAAAFAKVVCGIYNARRRTNILPEWVWTR